MMSPQAGFANNYGYGFSPHRPGSQRKRVPSVAEENNAIDTDEGGNNDTTQAHVTPTKNMKRASPATVETTAATSISETA
jgi:hypothetical protein